MKVQFDSTIIEAVHWINQAFGGKVVFCGSFALKYNGLIDRVIKDIDCFTESCIYGTKESAEDFGRETSGKFFVDGVQVLRVKGATPNGISVDYIHAVRAKEQYLKSPQLIHKEKHENDLRTIYQAHPEFENKSVNDDIPF